MSLNTKILKADGLLLVTATLWGFAFSAAKESMYHVGPFFYNGICFTLGALTLLPFLLFSNGRKSAESRAERRVEFQTLCLGGTLAGLAMFCGSTFQQMGIVHTTAGKAGFITGLYVVIVPLLGLFRRHKVAMGTWVGATLAVVGLYFLSITRTFGISPGDPLVFVGAFFWALQILAVARFSPRIDPVGFACFQFAVCALLSFLAAFALETITLQKIFDTAVPCLFNGVFGVGLAFTLQVMAQRHAHPAHAAILMSMETVVAALGGWLLLNEALSARALLGCALMLAGMLSSQLSTYLFPARQAPPVASFAVESSCADSE